MTWHHSYTRWHSSLAPDISLQQLQRKPPRTPLHTPRAQQGGTSEHQVSQNSHEKKSYAFLSISCWLSINILTLEVKRPKQRFAISNDAKFTFSKTVLHFFSRSVEHTFSLKVGLRSITSHHAWAVALLVWFKTISLVVPLSSWRKNQMYFQIHFIPSVYQYKLLFL